MRSRNLSTNKLTWNSPLLDLAGKKKPSQSLIKLFEGGILSLKDLLWIFPLRLQKAPELSSFTYLEVDKLFLGRAKIISTNFTPTFGRGKGKVQLFNATCVIKDLKSEKYLNLKWFNTYPGLKKQLEAYKEFNFMGIVSDYKGTLQIVNPKINPPDLAHGEMLIEYPTLHSVSGRYIKNIIDKIPQEVWDSNIKTSLNCIIETTHTANLVESFKVIHGKTTSDNTIEAMERIIYQEFFENQIKVLARKLKNKNLIAPIIKFSDEFYNKIIKKFPYTLTDEQLKVIGHVKDDFNSGHPMMRMVQGDVGCGKTSVAIVAAELVISQGGQVAFMCPTEALALQHAQTLRALDLGHEVHLLLGSTKAKVKKETYSMLKSGDIKFIIGTHSLFQDSVEFKNLQLAIIDEQHKFGVGQRLKLVSKGDGTHSLIMTATPIPRSLQLAQYGDLDISTIRSLPGGRKGIQTRIVTTTTYDKYLSFLITRISLGEQAYIVVPAIDESETLNVKNVTSLLHTYKQYFPKTRIEALHGQLKTEEKQLIMEKFTDGLIDILISTTVIEVGINVLNSTVVSIYNPERFGLSSIHQLRGRVGRGEKPGFCFLITDKKISPESNSRLKVIEKTLDGFEIAEADLSNRGQGDLFGNNQSGHGSHYKVANIFEHFHVFEKVSRDLETLKRDKTEHLNKVLLSYTEDTNISSTI